MVPHYRAIAADDLMANDYRVFERLVAVERLFEPELESIPTAPQALHQPHQGFCLHFFATWWPRELQALGRGPDFPEKLSRPENEPPARSSSSRSRSCP